VRGVREGLASLGVCWDATDHSGLHARPYRRDTLCVVVPAGPLTCVNRGRRASGWS